MGSNSIVDMRDLVPWSIIYGAQNERHAQEIINIYTQHRKDVHLMVCTILETFFSTQSFYQPLTKLWTGVWPLIRDHVDVADINALEETYLKERPHTIQAFQAYYERDIETRARYLRSLIGCTSGSNSTSASTS